MTQETAVILEEMRDWGQDDWADAIEALEASNAANREALAAKDALIKELARYLEQAIVDGLDKTDVADAYLALAKARLE